MPTSRHTPPFTFGPTLYQVRAKRKDPHRAARGIFLAVFLGAIVWSIFGLAVWVGM
jgi:hypothetical protein